MSVCVTRNHAQSTAPTVATLLGQELRSERNRLQLNLL
jgi:hypothetical protein